MMSTSTITTHRGHIHSTCPDLMVVHGLHMGVPTGGSGAAGGRRFTDTLASGLGNIHPDGQVGWDWGKRRPLFGDTASQQDDENVTTEELRGPEASPEEMLSGNFSAMSFISVAQNFMMDAMHAAYIDKFA